MWGKRVSADVGSSLSMAYVTLDINKYIDSS